jgi:hypothetical protein
MKRRLVYGALASMALTLPAHAHHSFAMFDSARETTLEGTVKEFQWTNPHAWVQVLVTGPDGKVTEWSIECASPNALKRQGWRSTTVKSGDKVKAIIHPLKSGEPGGSLVILTLPDGTQLGRRAPPPPEGAPKEET